jgi:hypothetical protein
MIYEPTATMAAVGGYRVQCGRSSMTSKELRDQASPVEAATLGSSGD